MAIGVEGIGVDRACRRNKGGSQCWQIPMTKSQIPMNKVELIRIIREIRGSNPNSIPSTSSGQALSRVRPRGSGQDSPLPRERGMGGDLAFVAVTTK